MKEVQCSACGEKLHRYPYQVEGQVDFYCDKDCESEHKSKERVERECNTCGETVFKKISQDKLSELSFCDRECKFKYFTGDNHPNSVQNPIDSRYYGKNWEEQRTKAIDRDDSSCRICGEDEMLLHVHHLKPFSSFDDYKKANKLRNLRTLCAKCHGEVENAPVGKRVSDAAKEVHSVLGPGHTESTYHRALEREMAARQIPFSSEGSIPIFYKSSPVGRRRPDLFVESDDGTIVVELKAGTTSGGQQLLQYLDLLGEDENFNIVEGYLIQFNADCEIETKSVDQ